MEYKASVGGDVVCAWELGTVGRQVRCQVVPSPNPVVYVTTAIELGKHQKSEIVDVIAAELPAIQLLSGQIVKVRRQLLLAERSPHFRYSDRCTLDSHVATIQEELHSVRDRMKSRILSLLSDDQKQRIDDIEVAFASQRPA
ncbi:MAG TPA: hypothetical protein VI756_18960 [Blastocatellia bacterium]